MQIQVDFRSGHPIYLQIVEQVQLMVANGELKIGDQLPTVRQLAADLRVNFNTVARAYRILDEIGMISTQQGRGTYIWETPTDMSAKKLRQQGLHDLTQRYIDEAERMGFSPDEISKEFEEQLALLINNLQHQDPDTDN
jgi:GntR family transcriptional regulator